jgi:hypothetical protein
MLKDQDIAANTAWHHLVRSTVVWAVLAIMAIAVGLLLSPIPLARNSHARTAHSFAASTNVSAESNRFVQQEPDHIDHPVLNDPDLLPAPNPAPMAIAAYD